MVHIAASDAHTIYSKEYEAEAAADLIVSV